MRIWILAGACVTIAFATESDSRIWSGVYTTAQAERGKSNFEKNCSNCHNSNLSGSVRGPALRSDGFLKNWSNTSANALFVKLRDSMPATYPESVPDIEKIDILAYLLQANGFPAGKMELPLDLKELGNIQIVQKGEQTAPNFALVHMVGCLTPGSEKYWTLTRASEPAVTKDERPTQSALQEAAGRTLGAGTFDLLGAVRFQPESHTGQKVEARGLLYRDSGKNLINLTSLEATGADCRN
jgi:quinoprotein glucose dehydrogenase